MAQLEKAHSALQQEAQDAKGLVTEYERRFTQVKLHIESINTQHAGEVEAISAHNRDLKEELQTLEQKYQGLQDEKMKMAQKLRDLEWQND